MKIIIKNLKLIFDIFSLSHKFDSKITLFEFLHGLCLNLKKVLNVVMPAFIVNLIFQHERWMLVGTMAILYGVFQGLLGCGEKSFKLLQEAHGFRACNLLRLSMNKKFMRIDYADTENSSVVDSFEKAKESMWEFADVGYVIFDDILGNLITFICMSYILFDINLIVYIVVLFIICMNIVAQYKKNKIVHESDLKEQVNKKWLNYVSGLMQDYKVGKEIRIFDTKEFMLSKYFMYAENIKKQVKEREKKVVKLSIFQGFLYLCQLLIVYLAAMKKYVRGDLPIGSFLLYISSINELTDSVKNLLAACIELSKVSFYYNDYVKFMDIPEYLNESGEEKISKNQNNIIEFKNVSFYYPGSKKAAIKNLSFSFGNNDKIAIVGENGSGKSTLIKLLLRLYDPTEGAVYFNGKNIKDYEYNEYLNVFKTVFQDFSVFSYTILENIVFDQDIDSERLSKILDIVGLKEKIQKYEAGLNSMVTKVLDDNGINLSGGELQLVAISRAFYHNSKIVVFDEPTAALDPIKEAKIYELIERVAKDKETVFCAHRMSSTKFCDKIVVLEKGCLIEIGNHDELMHNHGIYYNMFLKQAKLYKENGNKGAVVD